MFGCLLCNKLLHINSRGPAFSTICKMTLSSFSLIHWEQKRREFYAICFRFLKEVPWKFFMILSPIRSSFLKTNSNDANLIKTIIQI